MSPRSFTLEDAIEAAETGTRVKRRVIDIKDMTDEEREAILEYISMNRSYYEQLNKGMV